MTKRLSLLAAIAVTLAAVVVGWRTYAAQRDAAEPPPSQPTVTEPAEGSPSASPTPAEEPPAAPEEGACHRLTYAEAVAPTAGRGSSSCDAEHTSVTFAVGELDAVVDGHLVAVDSARVRDQVSTECPELFTGYVGGTEEQRRLSLLRPVGFTPTVQQSDQGATWFRCDAVAVAEDSALAPLAPELRGVLDTEEGRARYGRCAPSQPGSDSFRTVICSGPHTWRAVRTVTFDEGPYPGTQAVRAAGDQPCEAAGRTASGDALDFEWGYEWPTAERWRAGMTYGFCWVPDPA